MRVLSKKPFRTFPIQQPLNTCQFQIISVHPAGHQHLSAMHRHCQQPNQGRYPTSGEQERERGREREGTKWRETTTRPNPVLLGIKLPPLHSAISNPSSAPALFLNSAIHLQNQNKPKQTKKKINQPRHRERERETGVKQREV